MRGACFRSVFRHAVGQYAIACRSRASVFVYAPRHEAIIVVVVARRCGGTAVTALSYGPFCIPEWPMLHYETGRLGMQNELYA